MTGTVELLKKSKTKVASVDQDQILDVAHELENLTKEKAEELAYELVNNEGQNEFRLGGVFNLIKSNGWFDGYKDFKAYTLEKFGVEYRKAQYCINIYDRLVSEQISWNRVAILNSWTKVCILVPIITAENVDEWVTKAQGVNCDTLKAMVKAALTGTVEEDEVKITSEVTKMAFTVHPDQKETITQALEKAKVEVNSEFSTVALEAICLGFLSGAVQSSKPVATLKEQMKAAGIDTILALFEEIWPKVNLTVDIPEDAVV